MSDGWLLVTFFGGFIVGVFALVVGIDVPADYYSCRASYEAYDPQWGFLSGCRIMWHGRLTPVDIIRKVDINQ